METGQPSHRREWGSLTLCVVLSLLLHLGLAWSLDLLPHSGRSRSNAPSPRSSRHVQVLRSTPRQAKATPHEQNEKREEKPFAKTSADEPEQRPQQADFIGNHHSVASGDEDAPRRTSDAPLPTMAGREQEDEIVTFDQERQDGELAHEGKSGETPPTPPSAIPAEPTPPAPAQPVAQGTPDGTTEQPDSHGEGSHPPQPAAEATTSLKPAPPTPGEGLRLGELHTENSLTLNPQQPPPAPLGVPDGRAGTPTTPSSPQHPRLAVFDPSLAPHIRQPGLRTYERRTRSTGRFVFGRRPALNVASTPRGRYEAEIYRRIARVWYATCDEHRGDIIPGSITVSLRLTRSGGIDSMELMRRRGASVIQQSFSFGAIRRAALPPMPAEIQQDIIGELYEMILTFNFD